MNVTPASGALCARRTSTALRAARRAGRGGCGRFAGRLGGGEGACYTNPFRTAHTAAWVRSFTWIFLRTFCTCSLTVSTLISSA